MATSLELKALGTCTPDRQLTEARLSPAADRLVGGGFDGSIRSWLKEEEAWQEQPPLGGHQGWVTQLQFSADGLFLYSADSWGQLRCWKLSEVSWQDVWTIPTAHDGWLRSLSLSPDGSQLATCGRDGCLHIWTAATGEKIAETTGLEDQFSVRWHPLESALITGDLFGKVQVWSQELKPLREFNAAELYTEHRLQEIGGARRIALTADGKTLAVAGTRPKNGGNVQGVPLVLLFDWTTGEQTGALELGATSDVYVTDLLFHPDGFLLATTSGNPGTGQIVAIQPDETKPFFVEKKLGNCHSLSWQQNNSQLAITSTSKGSNGNGRKLDADGNYLGNTSLISLFEMTIGSGDKPKE